ncbi:neprilysin-11-like isoform X2 [Lycorma delicatula]|uniref:neprilysin-11-like isoform X2 n=1 Tax=Lycorma delicatula TaxID=130591 RepID=UPI003F510065
MTVLLKIHLFYLFIIIPFIIGDIYGAYISEVCETEDCVIAAKEIASSLNKNVNPCDDFYEYACGGWRKSHIRPQTEHSWNSFIIATNRVYAAVKEFLESDNGITSNDPLPLQSAKMMYTACMDKGRIELNGLKPLIDLIELYGGWPMLKKYWKSNYFDFPTVMTELNYMLYYPAILHIDVSTDFKNSSKRVLYIDQPSLVILRQMLVSPETYSSQVNAYKSFVKEIAKLFLPYVDNGENRPSYIDYETDSRISREVDDIIQFEIEIAKIMSPSEKRRDMNRMYNKMTLLELQSRLDLAMPYSGIKQHRIDWLKLMRSTFKHTNIRINGNEIIVVREIEYVMNLAKLLNKTPIKTIANYLIWRIIEEFGNELSTGLKKLNFEFRKKFTGTAKENPRWKECIKSTQLAYGLALGYKFTQLHFDDKSEKSALNMVNTLHSSFYNQMDEVSWMDQRTKLAAKEKIQYMKKFIGFPSWYTNNITMLNKYYSGLQMSEDNFINMKEVRKHHNLLNLNKLRIPVDRDEWPQNEAPVTVNAFYSPFLNAIIFPAAVLQPPFFSKDRPAALNYGGIGVVIGHEITHGFDDLGRQYDKFGNLAQWWTEKTIASHYNRSKCFIEQYSNFVVPELSNLLLETVKINGLLTLGENMADNGGLYQAYKAYKQSLFLGYRTYIQSDGYYTYQIIQPNYASDKILPGLEEFSSDQLFFLGFASNWCESQTNESLLHEVLSNVHSPNKFRVIGTVKNSLEFAKAFNCPVNSPMNPKNKCPFW